MAAGSLYLTVCCWCDICSVLDKAIRNDILDAFSLNDRTSTILHYTHTHHNLSTQTTNMCESVSALVVSVCACVCSHNICFNITNMFNGKRHHSHHHQQTYTCVCVCSLHVVADVHATTTNIICLVRINIRLKIRYQTWCSCVCVCLCVFTQFFLCVFVRVVRKHTLARIALAISAPLLFGLMS